MTQTSSRFYNKYELSLNHTIFKNDIKKFYLRSDPMNYLLLDFRYQVTDHFYPIN